MTHEAAAVAADDGTGEGAVGEVEGDTEGEVGENVDQGKCRGVIGVAAVVSEGQQQLWPPSWECC